MGLFPYWIAFYFVGVYFSRHDRTYSITIVAIIMVLAAFMQVLPVAYARANGNVGWGEILTTYTHSVTAWIYEICIVLFLLSERVEQCYSRYRKYLLTIEKVGVHSFGIYLIHVYWQLFLEKFFHVDSWILRWVVMTTLSIVTVYLLAKLLPPKAWKLFGIN